LLVSFLRFEVFCTPEYNLEPERRLFISVFSEKPPGD
jgi:hypothetical protein